jgi:hypothetical protein
MRQETQKYNVYFKTFRHLTFISQSRFKTTFLFGGLGVEEQRKTFVKSQITPRDFFLWG